MDGHAVTCLGVAVSGHGVETVDEVRRAGRQRQRTTSSAFTLSNIQSNKAGNYLVVVTNAAGSVTSAVAILTVYVPAGIATQPSSQTTTQGLNAAFSVVPSGTAPFSYQWCFNGAALSGASNASLVLTNVDPTDAGSYTVAVTNVWGSVTSAVATLTVRSEEHTSELQSLRHLVCRLLLEKK